MTGDFPAIALGKCGHCGDDGLLYDAGGVLYCKRCQWGFLDSTVSYQTEDGYVFFLLRDGTVSDGDLKYASVAKMKRNHDVIRVHQVTIQ